MRAYRTRKREEREAQQPPAAAMDYARVTDAVDAFEEWAGAQLIIPTGPLAGQRFKLGEWQRAFVREALAVGIREAGLSVARKNGKSGLISALLLAYLAGPLNVSHWRGVVVSLTGALAKELKDAIEALAIASGLHIDVRQTPWPGQIRGARGARLDILASDKATGHAIGADLVIIDEAGLLEENKRALWNALLSSVSGRDGRLVCISIRGLGPMFSELAERADDGAVVWHEYAGPDGAALDDADAWTAANPGLVDGIKSMAYMKDAARRAIVSPADAPDFRAYDLNQPQQPSVEMLCDVGEWLACETDALPPRAGSLVIGFDIGGAASLTALVAFWPSTGRLEAWAACGDNPTLEERGRADGVGRRYERMQERGELILYPGRVTPAAAFLNDMAARLEGWHVVAAGADRFRKAEVLDALDAAGVDWPIYWRAKGPAQQPTGATMSAPSNG